ncbi:MAG: hypothetical protein ACE5R6_00920 [Candidatus Heimdallarchaeota archaeon]
MEKATGGRKRKKEGQRERRGREEEKLRWDEMAERTGGTRGRDKGGKKRGGGWKNNEGKQVFRKRGEREEGKESNTREEEREREVVAGGTEKSEKVGREKRKGAVSNPRV